MLLHINSDLMKFRVGPWTYRVRIHDSQKGAKPLKDENGIQADGLCCWSEREIWISDELKLECRSKVLCHELHHAWIHHMGRPGSDEDQCNQVSSFTHSYMRQLARQGGLASLMRLGPDGVVLQAMAWKTTDLITPSSRHGWLALQYQKIEKVTS